ncbi:MAG: sodium/proline symporter [Methylophilaceae bacterium]|jgi:sodium/proline symporter
MMTVISFITFLSLFFIIGLASTLKSKGTRKDYYLAGQSVSPLFSGLSAVATNNSGYMFIGVIGYTYQVGLSSVWLMVGWIAGDFLASLYIHKKLHIATSKTNETSFSGVLAKWSGEDMRVWRRIAALFTLVFLGTYAAAQISAGSKALEGVLGWDRSKGAWLVALMVLSYSMAGGIRASIWTDVAQSFVMLAAMCALVWAGTSTLGGINQVVDAWQAIPYYFDIMPQGLAVSGLTGVILFVIGWFVAGLSVIGQPHIMVRFMALKDAESIKSARIYYYGFFIIFYLLATTAGMLARLHLPDLSSLDPEMALPNMAVQLLPPVLVGMVLAGIFAATMSTADSLVLSCSSSIVNDLLPKYSERPKIIKSTTALVTGFSLLIALYASSSVFDLVIVSWSVMAVVFAPLLILLVMHRQITQRLALLIMAVGVAVILLWRYANLHNMIYEGLPSIFIAVALGYLASQKQKT